MIMVNILVGRSSRGLMFLVIDSCQANLGLYESLVTCIVLKVISLKLLPFHIAFKSLALQMDTSEQSDREMRWHLHILIWTC